MKSREETIAFARESLGLVSDAAVELVPFAGRGSDRFYYRVLWNDVESAILVQYEPGRIENTYYADIACFLTENGIPVPEILCHDPARCFILMKDLGDTDLWALREEPWHERRRLYEKTLRIVHRLHSFPESMFPGERVQLMEAFGPNLYEWERNYFKDNFVQNLCGLELEADISDDLETELAALAEKLSSGRRSLVHRDLQSQNVMICGDAPYLIDFQGMRFGTRFYDLGSILCDPYVTFAEDERGELLRFYYGLSDAELGYSEFQNAFWEASAQRLMQALGAYGFLGAVKGLKNYLVHVPSGLKNLRAAARHAVSLPVLSEVCVRCQAALEDSQFRKSGLLCR